jgi:uncharacterized protein
MSAFEDLSFCFEDFTGVVRLLPLPNLVLFPHVMQPLHIFEPRYRKLVEDALAGDQLITPVLLTPGWEKDYDGRPPVCRMACLGRITTHHRLEDGTYNLLLLGLRRVRLARELPAGKIYREAEVSLCEDEYPSHESAARGALQRQIREALLNVLPLLAEAQEQLDQLLGADVPLGLLTDVVSYMLDVELTGKQALLAELNVHRRAEILLGHLKAAGKGHADGKAALVFPPQFSAN